MPDVVGAGDGDIRLAVFHGGEQLVVGAGIGPGDFQTVALEDARVAGHVHRQFADVPGWVKQHAEGVGLGGGVAAEREYGECNKSCELKYAPVRLTMGKMNAVQIFRFAIVRGANV